MTSRTKKLIVHFIVLVLNVAVLTALPSWGESIIVDKNSESRFLGVPTTVSTIEANGYPAETHHVITEDGYILEVHRIPYGRYGADSRKPRPVVFVMHGLLAASQCFVGSGPNSLAFYLVDAGFDVWMGNARGNRHSRAHISWNPHSDKFDFFDLTWEEIGMIDVASMVDYVLAQTGREKLHYIGHSQGGTAFLVLNSMRPEYNNKFISAHLLAGVGYMKHFPQPTITGLAQRTTILYALARGVGLVEIFPLGELPIIPGLLEIINIPGINDLFTTNVVEFGACAIKQIAHYGQNIRDGSFRRWDYGSIRNLVVYGSRQPPAYNLGLITVNTTMHYSLNDVLLDERDAVAMANDMPNTVARKIVRESFTHFDYLLASDAKELVIDYVIEAIKRDDNADNSA